MTPESFHFQRHFCQFGEELVVGSISSSSVFLSVVLRATSKAERQKGERVQEDRTGGLVGSR